MTYYKIVSIRNPHIYRIAFTINRALELKAKLGQDEYVIRTITRAMVASNYR